MIRKVRDLMVTMLLCAVVSTGAKAETDDSADNPRTQQDPDGVPLSVTEPKQRQLTPAEIDAVQKRQQKAAVDKDWLLRSYEQQLLQHANAPGGSGTGANLYYQLSTDKELSKLAGVAPLGVSDTEQAASLHTGMAGNGLTLRADSPAGQRKLPTFGSSITKPFLTPMGMTDSVLTHSYYHPQPTAAPLISPSAVGAVPKAAPPVHEATQDHDPLAMQTPGQVAAEQNPNLYLSGMDPNLEPLPGETAEQARQRLITSPPTELSMPLQVQQPLKAQPVASALATAHKKVIPLVPVAPAQIEDLNAPTPVDKLPAQSPVRAPISDPYDIFYR